MTDNDRQGPAGAITPAELWRTYDMARRGLDSATSALVDRIDRIARRAIKADGVVVIEVDRDGVVVTQYLGRGYKSLRLTSADMDNPAPLIENHFAKGKT